MILTLVPLTMYVVRYEVAHGRPYSKLEELLLKSVNPPTPDGGHTFAELRDVFKVHDRLLTEALVTLIQEGWIAMEQQDAEIRYLVTEEGRRTIASGRRPSNLRVRTKHAKIIRERLTGQLARASDLVIMTATELRGSIGGPRKVRREALTPRVIRTEINGGEAERLLPRSDERQEWVRWIDSVSRVSQDLHYLPVQVDLEKSTVLGLPYQWQHLSPSILEEVSQRFEEMTKDVEFQNEILKLVQGRGDRNSRQREAEDTRDPFIAVSAVCTDIAITAQESIDMIDRAISKSSDHVFLAVGNLDVQRAAVVRDTLIRLVSAKVKVDLLWSCDESANVPKDIYRVLSAARAKAPQSSTPMLVLNAEPSEIATDLLLTATADGPAAVIGSAFVGQEPLENALAVSVRISAPAALAALARLCAGWWESTGGEQALLAAHRWNHYGERWSDEGALPASPEPDLAKVECPHRESGRCSGEVAIITGAQQEAIRAGLLAEQGRRFLLSDGQSTTDDLLTAFTEACGIGTGYLYQAFGGCDGWYFLRRQESDKWADYRRTDLAPPSAAQKVTGTAHQWMVSTNSGGQIPALSILLTGHIAATAWERTSHASQHVTASTRR
jgi:hypothetical protein